MNAPVRYACIHARMRALGTELLGDVQLARVRASPALCTPPATDAFSDLYPPLVRWYDALIRTGTRVTPILETLLCRHEIENLKLLWRSALRRRPVPPHLWRPLGRRASVAFDRAPTIARLLDALAHTPYARLSRETWRSHGEDLIAAELAFEHWVYHQLAERMMALSPEEGSGRALLADVLRERDLDLLRRGRDTYELDPAMVVGLAVLLPSEAPRASLQRLAAWEPSAGPISTVLPRTILSSAADAHDWDDVVEGLRRRQAAACRRALMAWPFQAAPILAAVLLREQQMRLWIRLAAARRAV